MSKKILSIVLALTLALSCFAIGASAIGEVGYEEEGSTYTQAWSLSEAAQNDSGVWYVEVSLTANYTVGAMQFQLEFSNTNIKINDVIATKQDGTAGALTAGYNADVAFDTTGASNIVAIIPNPVEDASAAVDFTAGGVVCTVFFTVPDGESGTVQIVNDSKSATNPGGTLFAARVDDGILSTGTSITGQATTIATPARNIGALPADLAKTASADAGILIDTAHTFGGAYKGVVYGFTQKATNTFMTTGYLTTSLTATNGGTLAFSRSIGTMGYGTGTVITVKNADGTEAAKYVVVIFGDVDGNGLINGNDVTAVYNQVNVSTTYASNSVQRMAANCQNTKVAALNDRMNANDITAIYNNINVSYMSQATLASNMQANTQYYV